MMDKDMTIRVAGIRNDSSDDGPGLRTVIFFSRLPYALLGMPE